MLSKKRKISRSKKKEEKKAERGRKKRQNHKRGRHLLFLIKILMKWERTSTGDRRKKKNEGPGGEGARSKGCATGLDSRPRSHLNNTHWVGDRQKSSRTLDRGGMTSKEGPTILIVRESQGGGW